MLNCLIVSNLVVGFATICCLVVSASSLAIRVVVLVSCVVQESARQKWSLALVHVRKVRNSLCMVLPRGED